MLEPRIYRAAFVPALLAVVLVMFSLESRPRPLGQGLPADVVFVGPAAVTTTATIVRAARDRRAGKPGDRVAARQVVGAFRGRGFTTEVDRFTHGSKDLVNVIGRRAGRSRRQIVVVAARDAAGVPDAAGSASDTAALIELARVFEGRPSRRTLVLASVDGSALGEVGTERLIGRIDRPELVDGVIVMSGFGTKSSTPTAVVPWSGDTRRAGIGLERTVAESIREELGSVERGAGAVGQLGRLAFPLGIGAQGPLLARGHDAVRIAGGGELGDSGETEVEDVDPDRIGGLGRATLRTVTALDQGGRPKHGPENYVTIVSQVMPGWVLALLSLTLIVPALVAGIDAFARARRRHAAVLPWFLWIGAGALALAIGLALSHALAVTGVISDPPEAPVAPDLYPLDAGAVATLAVIVAITVVAWLALRFLSRTDPVLSDPSAPGAAVACTLVLALAMLVLWFENPFSALVLVPALHLWMLATLVDPGPPRRARIAMVALGLLLPLLLGLYLLVGLSLDPVSGAWYLLLLLTGGHVSLAASLVGCAVAAVLASVVVIVRAERPEDPEPSATPSVRGPASYAGPGSLGGTESALGRR